MAASLLITNHLAGFLLFVLGINHSRIPELCTSSFIVFSTLCCMEISVSAVLQDIYGLSQTYGVASLKLEKG